MSINWCEKITIAITIIIIMKIKKLLLTRTKLIDSETSFQIDSN